jgi:hypothetical protein
LNIDNEVNAKMLEFLKELRGEEIVKELERQGKDRSDEDLTLEPEMIKAFRYT